MDAPLQQDEDGRDRIGNTFKETRSSNVVLLHYNKHTIFKHLIPFIPIYNFI